MTKNGRIARSILIISLVIGLTSKIIELKQKSDKDASDAYRARIAAEQTLRIAKNTERLANVINKINLSLKFKLKFKDSLLRPYAKVLNRFENAPEDQWLTIKQFRNLVPHDPRWRKIADELLNFNIGLIVYPGEAKPPACVVPIMQTATDRDVEPDSIIKFDIPFSLKYVKVPQMEDAFQFEFVGDVKAHKSPQIIALMDFNGAFVKVYTEVMVTQAAQSKVISKPAISYTRTAPMYFKNCDLSFTINQQRSIWPEEMKALKDTCSGFPYFLGKINIDPKTL